MATTVQVRLSRRSVERLIAKAEAEVEEAQELYRRARETARSSALTAANDWLDRCEHRLAVYYQLEEQGAFGTDEIHPA